MMRFINNLLVCFFFPLFQVSSFRLCLLHQYLSLLPRRLTSLSVCLHVCLSVFVCMSICLSLSLYLSLSIYFSHFRYIFCSFCLCLFRSIIQYFYLTQRDYFFLSFLVRPFPISLFSLSLSLSSLFLSPSFSVSLSVCSICYEYFL